MGGVGVGITKTLRGRNLALAFVRLTRTAWTFFKICFLQGLKLVTKKQFVKFGWKILTLGGLKSRDKMGHPWTIRGHLGLRDILSQKWKWNGLLIGALTVFKTKKILSARLKFVYPIPNVKRANIEIKQVKFRFVDLLIK